MVEHTKRADTLVSKNPQWRPTHIPVGPATILQTLDSQGSWFHRVRQISSLVSAFGAKVSGYKNWVRVGTTVYFLTKGISGGFSAFPHGSWREGFENTIPFLGRIYLVLSLSCFLNQGLQYGF